MNTQISRWFAQGFDLSRDYERPFEDNGIVGEGGRQSRRLPVIAFSRAFLYCNPVPANRCRQQESFSDVCAENGKA